MLAVTIQRHRGLYPLNNVTIRYQEEPLVAMTCGDSAFVWHVYRALLPSIEQRRRQQPPSKSRGS
jgi:hypothetical protein